MAQQSAGMPYIGSIISLISKTGVRYEGTLYTIDMVESTIALQNGTVQTPPAATGHCALHYQQGIRLQFIPSVLRDGSRMAPKSLLAKDLSNSSSSEVAAVHRYSEAPPVRRVDLTRIL